MRAKFLLFPTVPKSQRLAERVKIVSKNFSDDVYGVALMDYVLLEIYNQFKDGDDFYSEQICAKTHEARAYLEFFEVENEERNGDKAD